MRGVLLWYGVRGAAREGSVRGCCRYEGDKMIEAVDTDGSGEIELDEFVAMMQTTKSASLGTIKTQLNQLHDLFMM